MQAFSNRDNLSRFHFLRSLTVVLIYANRMEHQRCRSVYQQHRQLKNTTFPDLHPNEYEFFNH